MNGDLDVFSGVPVIKSPNAVEWGSKKLHKKKRWMKKSYHERIQKKWDKRFGFWQKPAAYKTSFGIICHPSIYEEMIRFKEQM